MRLKAIVIDGFKSYAHRQELGDLDAHFNAITGLNGSGKSNIFDAICFVMGISNLKKVRAEDPSELIYKNGHAGIQRASVTIEFSNDDPRTAPTGYPCEQFATITVSRQILTGGRQKFFLNGKVSDQSKVKQFFHAVSLNVDNPHFLVLQGTVHKLVNMRPQEILGMLEEAAGTRVFDARRRNAENMMLGKERKVKQLNETLDTEIGPMLHQMKDAQDAYAKYVAIVDGLEGMRKFRTAHGYWEASKRLEQAASHRSDLAAQLKTSQATLEQLPGLRREADARVEDTELKMHGPTERVKRAEEDSSVLRKDRTAAVTRVKAALKSHEGLEKQCAATAKEQEQLAAKLGTFVQSSEERQAAFRAVQQDRDTAESEVAQLKESLRLQKSGIRAGMGGKTIEQEHADLERELLRAEEGSKRLAGKVQSAKRDIETMKASAADGKAEQEKLRQDLARAEATRDEANAAFAPYEELIREREELNGQRQKWQRAVERFEQQHTRSPLDLPQYDPVPGIDIEGGMRGRVATLVKVKDPSHTFALSAGVGGKLFNVVVNSDEITRALIERGRLRQRTSFIPLNKVAKGPAVDPSRIRAAEAVAEEHGGWAKNCVDLVSYDPALEGAMQKVFGGLLLVSSLEVAKAVANTRRAGLKCITIEGDVTNPNGVMTGGSKSGIRDWFAEAANRSGGGDQGPKVQLALVRNRLDQLDKQIADGHPIRQRAYQASSVADQLRNRLSQSTAAGVEQRIEATERELQAATIGLADATKHKERVAGRLQEVAALKGADSAEAERQLAAKLAAAEKRFQALKKQTADGQDDFRAAEDRKAELESRRADLESELAERQAEAAAAKADADTLREEANRLNARLEEVMRGHAADEDALRVLEGQLQTAKDDAQRLIDQEHDVARRAKEIESDIKLCARSQEECKKALHTLVQAHPWLTDAKDDFGPADGEYYFDDPARTDQTLKDLRENEALSEAMSRKVNKKATVQYEECKQQYEDLVSKRGTLEADKETIIETIKAVEEKKWSSLDAMVAKVSEGFSKLFGACLPNASAKLIDERDASTGRLTGVAVKVAFSGKEKESLTELSGGQRSLLALCLILAILRFRPAPMYILDEVDAALDPSHTQNIGRMLKEHFSDAQFLLVSLKDGMFSNANVVYQVRNTQGYSEVTRVDARRGRR